MDTLGDPVVVASDVIGSDVVLARNDKNKILYIHICHQRFNTCWHQQNWSSRFDDNGK